MESGIWYFCPFCLKKLVNPKENKGILKFSLVLPRLGFPLFSLGFSSFFKQNGPKYQISDSIYADALIRAQVRLVLTEFEEKSRFHQFLQMFELFQWNTNQSFGPDMGSLTKYVLEIRGSTEKNIKVVHFRTKIWDRICAEFY